MLTVDTPGPSCFEYLLYAPRGLWNRWADNRRGWVVEAALRVDPTSAGSCLDADAVRLWMHDDTHLVIVGLSPDALCIVYPDRVSVPLVTTDSLKAYRVEARGRTVRVYVDGRLVLDHTLSERGSGTRALVFGDGNGTREEGTTGSARSYWDYFSYDTTPGFRPSEWVGSAWPPETQRARALRLDPMR
jgi:hypothetical protein